MFNRQVLADTAFILVVFLIFAVLAFSVDHSGEFPINDDWGFSTPLLWYSEGRGVHVTYWQSMPYLSQLAIGILWVDFVGFSYESLRNLTLVQAALTIAFSYCLARAAGLDRRISSLISLSVAASPIFIGLSFSFMSDISGALFSVAACFFLALSIGKGKRCRACYFAGGLLLLCAIAIRQNSLGIAIAFFLTHLVFFRQDGARPFGALILVAAGVALYAATVPFMMATIGLPGDYGLETLEMISLLNDIASLRLGAFLPGLKSILHLHVGAGLILLPLAPVLIIRSRGQRLVIWAIIPLTFAIALFALILGQGIFQNMKSDILSTDGIGPRLIRGVPQEAFALSVALTLVGSLVSSLILLLAATSAWRLGRISVAKDSQLRIGLFLILCGLGVYAPHGLTYGALFDRYVILPTILISIGMFAFVERQTGAGLVRLPVPWPISITAAGLLCVTFVVSAAMTEDFFRWQRARYELIEIAYSEFRATVETFSGGFEYDNIVRIVDKPVDAKDIVATTDWDPPLYLAHSYWPSGKVLKTVRVATVLPFGSNVITLRKSDLLP